MTFSEGLLSCILDDFCELVSSCPVAHFSKIFDILCSCDGFSLVLLLVVLHDAQVLFCFTTRLIEQGISDIL